MKDWIKYGLLVMMSLAIVGSSIYAKTPDKHNKSIIDVIDVQEFFPDGEGTFIIRDLKENETFVYNQERANIPQAPESTFKIANALIGLQVKAVEDEYSIKKWDGVARDLEVWNKDHTLGSAMKHSVVWYYQALARDIGNQRMKEWLTKLSYGNADISGGIDSFWLNSSLKISPMQQVIFLEKLYKDTLPLDKKVMKTVKRTMIVDEGDTYTLYAKTGTRNNPSVGWYVGFLTTEDRTYVFATNVDADKNPASAKAKEITTKIFQKYKLLPAEK
ncbi:class D beta-lactamase [Brevibacillus daliensis]|uniref:class D beta-lactamase n=1 Tax=Brevibacillus daliensis TaxID=2892995 RepID=UPI001E589421|nr:class D beta-lactamase [Brevibacillus daliensis]